ncbi:dTDP-4-amino-4,6-dideoxygalactose transaminase [Desulfolutivibrio sulfoxidireducens]|uniref:dTDP-4-amino-4,6-dideoxygalactose transaminase n=1 Tax=Desulfolutivibrio sulfoxidireducens TaxID=2773299 RepID=UPI00159E228E|nr:dTDP-4-amino-4,6-dideoxygalactose transaminase [Desulfolutivibrio sulfoxidireducens]QLA20291.1 dTDP-4-amino-4,6-dideoxygalactose transaminase [Desulfolutivibrio sulfoxidireducens]
MNFKVPFNRPFIAGRELHYITQAVRQGHLSGDGYYSKRCQQWLAENFGVRQALLTHSCTAALEMAALLCEVGPGDEVIMPSFTFSSTATAFVLRGATPVFVDIRPDTLNLDEKLLEQALTPRTKVIVPVHYAGVPCEMDVIMDLASRHDVLVVEDAAQAFFSTYKGKKLGSFGQLGCLSFHETKNIISGEGGALLLNDPRFVGRAEIIREKGTNRSQFFRGQVDKYTWVDVGSSYLPSELIGAFLWGQIEEAERIIADRRRSFDAYLEALRPLQDAGHVQLPNIPDGVSNGHLFYIVTDSLQTREALSAYLLGYGISAIFHYVPLHSSPAGTRYGRAAGELPVTVATADRLLRLPLFFGMREEDVAYVTGRLFDFYCPKGKGGCGGV